MFSSPSIAGQSQQNNLVQEAQAAPRIQGPQFLPLSPAEQPVVNSDPSQPADPMADYQQQIRQKFKNVGAPFMPSFYGGESSY